MKMSLDPSYTSKPFNFTVEASWVNAILAGQLWPQPVLDFYLDHLVLEGDDGDEEVEETSEDWLVQIVEGLDLLDRGYKVNNKYGHFKLMLVLSSCINVA